MHSHHSHSGSYVAHGSDTLEGVTDRAIEMKFEVFCMTEHMPRLSDAYIYPEEHERSYTVKELKENFDRYCAHAKRIQGEKLADNCHTKFLVGLEVEGIDVDHIEYTATIREHYGIDMVVGSVHFLRGIPIDWDRLELLKLKDKCGGFRTMVLEYFQLQHKVIERLHPEVIGHFDLIRLFTRDDDVDDSTGKTLGEVDIENDWPDVWDQIKANLQLANSYGGLVELNSSAIRKKWSTPYPRADIGRAVKRYNDGRFCLSDDSHCIAQVGLNYHKVLRYVVEELVLDKLYYLDVDFTLGKRITVKEVSIAELQASAFWDQYREQ